MTRPAGQAGRIVERLEAERFAVVHVPAIEIFGIDPGTALRDVWRELGTFDFIHFASSNAIEHFFGYGSASGPASFGATTWFGVMGPGSRAVLARYVDRETVVTPGQESVESAALDSESMLRTLAALHAAPFHRALFVKGEGGRDVLPHAFRAQGSEIVEISVYRRRCPEASAEHRALLDRAARDTWCCTVLTSSEGTSNFSSMLDALGLARLRDCLALATHPRIAQTAQMKGWANVEICDPSDDALLHTLNSAAPSR